MAQAKNYAGKLAIRYAYATTARASTASTCRRGRKANCSRYPTPDELWNLTFAEQNAWRDRFAAVPFEDRGGYYPEPVLSGHRH